MFFVFDFRGQSAVSENNVLSNCENIENSTTKFNCKTFVKESLLSNSDDSFEVFLPSKLAVGKNRSKSSDNKPTSKQKVKKVLGRTRTCPYFSSKSVKSYFNTPAKSQEVRNITYTLSYI